MSGSAPASATSRAYRSAPCGCTEAGWGGSGGRGRFRRKPPPTSPNPHNLRNLLGGLMKHATIWLGLTVLLAAPAAAQWLREPVWNSPKGGTGLTISGDYARPNADYGKGNT